MTVVSARELLNQLREMIAIIAAPAEEQLDFLTVGVPAPADELLLQLDMAVPSWFVRLEQHGLIDQTSKDAIMGLRKFLGNMKGPWLWSDDALISSDEWRDVRERARIVLSLLADPESAGGGESVRGLLDKLKEFREAAAFLAAAPGDQVGYWGQEPGGPDRIMMQFKESYPSWSDLLTLRRSGIISVDTDNSIRRLHDSLIRIRGAAIMRWRRSGDRDLLDDNDVLWTSPDWKLLRTQAEDTVRRINSEGNRFPRV
jgi:hypothetical protein